VADRDPPGQRVRELWLIVGRRGGKDSIASLVALECARHTSKLELRPGEKPIVACLASDLNQAGIVFGYIKGYFESIPRLAPMIDGKLPNSWRGGGISLKNNLEIKVTTSNYKATRGRAIAGAILDEVAFWPSNEDSANPDIETYNALRPGMAMVPSAMLVGISTAYRKKGLLYNKWKESFGRDDPNVLVIQADTRSFNPTIDLLMPGEIDSALERDRPVALAEYFSVFRDDLTDYVPREVVEAAVVPGRKELAPERGITYKMFADASGGASDSFAWAIGHRGRSDRGVLDLLREVRSPFSPDDAVRQCVDDLKRYGLREIEGDRYAGLWVVEAFARHNISYIQSEQSKSEWYVNFLPILNSGRAELLDNPRLVNQFASLERRTSVVGRELINKPMSASRDPFNQPHDDLSNVTAAVLAIVAGPVDPMEVWRRMAV